MPWLLCDDLSLLDYLGRPEIDLARLNAMNLLGNGLSAVNHHEEALTVIEAQLSMQRRLGIRGRPRHARRSPRGRDDAQGIGTDRAAHARWRAPENRADRTISTRRASRAPRPRSNAAVRVRRPSNCTNTDNHSSNLTTSPWGAAQSAAIPALLRSVVKTCGRDSAQPSRQ